MASIFTGKKVFITGFGGTIGQELVSMLIKQKPSVIRGVDTNESVVASMFEKYQKHDNVQLFLGDVRDREKMLYQFREMQFVIHTAALKHVLLCERSPRDAISTNINGLQNVLEAAISSRSVQRVLFTSSDKAVNPTNVMGTTKLLGERMVTALSTLKHVEGPVFSSVRFGNVLGSHGSVIPIFKEQIAAGGPVTLTDEAMTRFVMTPKESIKIITDAMALSKGGEVFVTKMPIIKIIDLARVMINVLAPKYGHDPKKIKIQIVGAKAGEKFYEELLSADETRRAIELKNYYVVKPAFTSVYKDIDYSYEKGAHKLVDAPYSSDLGAPLSTEALRQYLIKSELL